MTRLAHLLLVIAAATEASLTLTRCWRPTGSSVPCLNDTINGNITYLSPSFDQRYDFTSLNISNVQDLPQDARLVYVDLTWRSGSQLDSSIRDLSFNNISQISCSIPSSLTFLNLSHNSLQGSWIQTPLTISTLDVRYNRGGLPWMENVRWGVFLPKLDRLVFRGNNLTYLRWGYDNFPMDQLSAVDVSDNPIAVVTITQDVYYRIVGRLTMSIDETSYAATQRACGGTSGNLRVVQTVPVEYPSQGVASYNYSWQTTKYFNVCYLAYTYATPQPTSDIQVSVMVVLAMASFFAVSLCAFMVIRVNAMLRERREVFHRGTICSSNFSLYEATEDRGNRLSPDQSGNRHGD
ncbi:hypothetical protein LEN26_002169 [Aphanomyces euteiches]|nr:hypothetical protein LEN26_002169 [Aphanomyces euteiches]KAH9187340.1 hypothetical protein AeNC1_010683 [Aphanomyces euteiches]